QTQIRQSTLVELAPLRFPFLATTQPTSWPSESRSRTYSQSNRLSFDRLQCTSNRLHHLVHLSWIQHNSSFHKRLDILIQWPAPTAKPINIPAQSSPRAHRRLKR